MLYMTKDEFEAKSKDLLRPGEWTEVYLDDGYLLMKRRCYCGDCGDWNTYGMTPYCPYCGKEKKVIE